MAARLLGAVLRLRLAATGASAVQSCGHGAAAGHAAGAPVKSWLPVLQAARSLHTQPQQSRASQTTSRPWLLGATGLGLGTALLFSQLEEAQAAAAPDKAAPGGRPGLPSFTQAEVAKHKTKESRTWVTFRDGVYDITDFVAMHPGGAVKIMLAAGGPVEPFWAMYQQHLKADVHELLAEYRVGTLADWVAPAAVPQQQGDPWAKEPSRHPALISRSDKPCNAETPGHILAASLITSTDIFFYVRNHLPVPDLDAGSWRLSVEGKGLRSRSYSLAELKAGFKKHSVAATVQCAGNRRNEMKAVKPVKGLDWETGAIGTAVWSGVLLRDVLAAAGLDPDDPSVAHVLFEGADMDPVTGGVYGASIPLDVAVAANKEVLLAYEMNGAPLSRDHGFPLRVVVPGIVGARHVKWLTRISAGPAESTSHWQQNDYKSFCPSTDWDTVDWSSAPAIQEAPITSAITEPTPGTALPPGTSHVTVRGYAWSGGGREVIRVDVSGDGGVTWGTASLKQLPQRAGRAWAWTLWEAEVPLSTGHKGPLQIVCKATDASYNSQPDGVAGVWNLRGVVNNAWHRVPVTVE